MRGLPIGIAISQHTVLITEKSAHLQYQAIEN